MVIVLFSGRQGQEAAQLQSRLRPFGGKCVQLGVGGVPLDDCNRTGRTQAGKLKPRPASWYY